MLVDTSTNGTLLGKTFNEAHKILDRIVKNNYEWGSMEERKKETSKVNAARAFKVQQMAAMQAQITAVTTLVKAMATQNPITPTNQVEGASCVVVVELIHGKIAPKMSNQHVTWNTYYCLNYEVRYNLCCGGLLVICCMLVRLVMIYPLCLCALGPLVLC